MLRKQFVLPLVGLVAGGQSAWAAPDPRVTATVLADNFVLSSSSLKPKGGQLVVDPDKVYLTPDGSRLAMVVTNQDQTQSAVLDGKSGNAFASIKSAQWSSGGRTFYFVGTKNGKQVIIRDNVPGNASAEGGIYVNGLKAVDTTAGQKVFYGVCNDQGIVSSSRQNWVLHGTAKPEDLNRLDDAFPNRDGSGVVLSGAPLGGADSLWRDGAYLSPTTRFGLNAPIEPVWSPDGKHLAFCVDNDKKHYFLVDRQSIFNIDEEPKVAWSPASDRFIVGSENMMTVVFHVAADGKTTLEYNAKLPHMGVPYWTKNGRHYGFYLPRTGELIVDGAAKAEGLHFDMGRIPIGRNVTAFEAMQAPRCALSEDGTHWAATDAKKGPDHVQSFVRWDGNEETLHDNIVDLEWHPDGSGPVYLTRDVTLQNAPETSAIWSLVSGNTALELTRGADSDDVRPLTGVLFPDGRTARVVMLEGTRIVRYDVRISP